jgi:putative cell wall-binding protein
VIANELNRLQPQSIVVAGGPASVSDAVLNQLKQYATSGSVTRIGGSDRYAVAAGVSAANFDSADTVYLATGGVFPDALSGGSPAAQVAGPMLLTTPWSLPASIAAEIQRLSPKHIIVLGGPASVSSTVISQLMSLVGS